MNDKVDVSEIEKKINKIMELTGASKDKAIVALHDCANELDKAIDMILEGDSINESEWKSQARKKKPKVGSTKESDSKVHLNGDAKKTATGKSGRQLNRGSSGGKQQQSSALDNKQQTNQNKSNFERGNKREPHWKSRETNNNDESTNNKELDLNDNNKLDEWEDETPTAPAAAITTTATSSSTTREITRETNYSRDRNKFNNENQFKSHNKYPSRDRDTQDPRDRRPPRSNYNDRSNTERSNTERSNTERSNYSSNRNFGPSSDRRSNYHQNKNYTTSKKPGSSYTNSIDTWSNLTATSDPNNQSSNNDYTQMTVGNWQDIVSGVSSKNTLQHNKQDLNDNNDEWTETSTSLIDPVPVNKNDHHQLPKMPNLASIVSGVKPVHHQQHPQNLQQHHKSPNQKQQPINLSNSNNYPIPSQHQQQQQPQNQQKIIIDIKAAMENSKKLNSFPPVLEDLFKVVGDENKRKEEAEKSKAEGELSKLSFMEEAKMKGIINDEYIKLTSGDYVNKHMRNEDGTQKILNLSNILKSVESVQQQQQQQHSNSHQQTIGQKIINQKSLIDKKVAAGASSNRHHPKMPAVQMPNSDQASQLNVQFGGLGIGTESYLNDDQIASKQQQQQHHQHHQHQQQQQQSFMNNSADKNNAASNLLSTVRGNHQINDKQQQQHQTKNILQSIDHQQLQDNILHHQDSRNKHPAGYHHQKSSAGLYGSNQQHHNDNSAMNSYKSNSYSSNNQQADNHPQQQQTSINYPPNLQNYGYPVNNYGAQNHNQQQHNNNSTSNSTNQQQSSAGSNQTSNQNANTSQKINLKDLDTSSNGQNNSNVNTTSSTGLGLVSNTTVTTNVLKNSLTATGKNNMQQPNVAPLLGTPQYIMSQPGLSAFYPIYDVPMAADHSFRYNQNAQDVKYNRSDANDGQVGQSSHGNVQSTQAPVTQTPNHQIFSQFPPYGFFYTGVNMMTQGLYQAAPPFLPIPGNPTPPSAAANQQPHANSTFPPKGAQNQQSAYAASAYSSAAYDPSINQLQAQDYGKQQNYSSGPTNSNQTQTSKQMSSAGSNDLANSNMYNKSHAQLTKVSSPLISNSF